jgi:hypothetical protein
MTIITTSRSSSLQWTLLTQPDDHYFADYLSLLSLNHRQMQDKASRLETTSAGADLKINLKKTELMKINTAVQSPVTVGGELIKEDHVYFIYLGSVVDRQGGTDHDIKSRIEKQSSVHYSQERLVLKEHLLDHQTANLQFQCKVHLTL